MVCNVQKKPSALAAAAHGDDKAFQRLARDVDSMLRRLARRYGCRDIDDAVQDILLEVWRSASRYDGRASERAFVATIARRRLIDRLRRASTGPAVQNLESMQDLGSSSPTKHVEAMVEIKNVVDALAGMRPDRREALLMAECQGMSHSEIASALGVPLGTVKSHARRAVLDVRRQLQLAAA